METPAAMFTCALASILPFPSLGKKVAASRYDDEFPPICRYKLRIETHCSKVKARRSFLGSCANVFGALDGLLL